MVHDHQSNVPKASDNERDVVYIYDVAANIIHDIDCSYGSQKKAMYRCFSEFPVCIKTEFCPKCYHRVFARQGCQGKKKLERATKLLQLLEAKPKDLYQLFIEGKAQIESVDQYEMQLRVGEDRWKIQRGISLDSSLWHNDYFMLEDGARVFESGFHKQHVPKPPTFSNMVRVMTGYTWNGELHRTRYMAEKLKHQQQMLSTDVQSKKQELRQCEQERIQLKKAFSALLADSEDVVSVQEAKEYLLSIYSQDQFQEFLIGAKHGLSLRQLLIYSDKNLTPNQMRQLRLGSEFHLSIKQVKSFAVLEYSHDEMRRKRRQLFLQKGPKEHLYFVADKIRFWIDQHNHFKAEE